jgi:hypothetical protein
MQLQFRCIVYLINALRVGSLGSAEKRLTDFYLSSRCLRARALFARPAFKAERFGRYPNRVFVREESGGLFANAPGNIDDGRALIAPYEEEGLQQCRSIVMEQAVVPAALDQL